MKMIVEGMTCGHCVHTITKAIHALDASVEVAVDLAAKTVHVTGGVDPALASAAIEAEGYTVVAIETDGTAAPDAPAAGASCCGTCHV